MSSSYMSTQWKQWGSGVKRLTSSSQKTNARGMIWLKVDLDPKPIFSSSNGKIFVYVYTCTHIRYISTKEKIKMF